MRVYTGGTFDLFHAGHVKFLKQCSRLTGVDGLVVVSLNTDEFIKEYKGKPPIMSYQDRKTILESCSYVDMVQKNEHTKEDAKKLQDLNSYRSQITNAINKYFDERQEVKL